jgi:type III secretion protein F
MNMGSLSFDSINTTVASAVSATEVKLQARVAGMDPANVSPTDLLLLQQDVSKWSMMTQVQSTLVKELSDTMKGIIQKAG